MKVDDTPSEEEPAVVAGHTRKANSPSTTAATPLEWSEADRRAKLMEIERDILKATHAYLQKNDLEKGRELRAQVCEEISGPVLGDSQGNSPSGMGLSTDCINEVWATYAPSFWEGGTGVLQGTGIKKDTGKDDKGGGTNVPTNSEREPEDAAHLPTEQRATVNLAELRTQARSFEGRTALQKTSAE